MFSTLTANKQETKLPRETVPGLELDSVAMAVRLSVGKLMRCTTLTEACLKKDKIQLKPLQSILAR